MKHLKMDWHDNGIKCVHLPLTQRVKKANVLNCKIIAVVKLAFSHDYLSIGTQKCLFPFSHMCVHWDCKVEYLSDLSHLFGSSRFDPFSLWSVSSSSTTQHHHVWFRQRSINLCTVTNKSFLVDCCHSQKPFPPILSSFRSYYFKKIPIQNVNADSQGLNHKLQGASCKQ